MSKKLVTLWHEGVGTHRHPGSPLQTILRQQGLQRIWGEKPNTYIIHGLDLQRCFHEVIQRVWYQKLGGEVNPYTLEGQLVFQLEDASYVLAHVFLYRSHVANAPTGVLRHRKGKSPRRTGCCWFAATRGSSS